MNKNIAKNTLAKIDIIKTPVQLMKYGEELFKIVDGILNTSLFSKSYVQTLRRAEIIYSEIECASPYHLYREVELAGLVDYAAYIDNYQFRGCNQYKHSVAVFCGFSDHEKSKLMITLAAPEILNEYKRGRK